MKVFLAILAFILSLAAYGYRAFGISYAITHVTDISITTTQAVFLLLIVSLFREPNVNDIEGKERTVEEGALASIGISVGWAIVVTLVIALVAWVY